MTFQEAVNLTSNLSHHYRPGLQALSDNDAARIRYTKPQQLSGSVNLDSALKESYPNEPRWDYGIGVRRSNSEVAVWVEVHPASSHSITGMLGKLEWLKSWLSNHAPALNKITQGDYYWVSTDGRIAITPNSPQAKKLAQAGLRGPMRVLRL
ncbi:MAG: hypothetical protein RMM98_11475 [Acidobacteriota bacterium]|nr:hypothetical protein [Blastocatellia bacterium]MDW8240227.1 hypothetical protein [Acidobacteriota bacterium]